MRKLPSLRPRTCPLWHQPRDSLDPDGPTSVVDQATAPRAARSIAGGRDRLAIPVLVQRGLRVRSQWNPSGWAPTPKDVGFVVAGRTLELGHKAVLLSPEDIEESLALIG